MDEQDIVNAIARDDIAAVAGNTLVAEIVKRHGLTVLRAERLGEDRKYAGAFVTSFSIRFPGQNRDDFLMVANGVAGDGSPQVAFHSADTFAECLTGGLGRILNGSIVWRLDKYGSQSGSRSG
jgi:hypothetical protein